jgi:hypothetical protein
MNTVVVKNLRGLNQVKQVKEHLKYIGFRSQELYKEKHLGFFSKDEENSNMKEFLNRIDKNEALQHPKSIKARKLVFSLKEWHYDLYKDTGADYKELIRSTLKAYEDEHNVKLDWIANVHDIKDHPHAHVVIKGVSDNKLERGYRRIKFKKDDIQLLKDNFDASYFSRVERGLYYAKEMDQTIGKHFDTYKSNPYLKIFKEDYEKILLNHEEDLFNEYKFLCDNLPEFYNLLYEDKNIDKLSKNIVDKILTDNKYEGISDNEKNKLKYFLLTRANIDRNNYVYIVNDKYMKKALDILKDTDSYNIDLSVEYEKIIIKLYAISSKLNINDKIEFITNYFNKNEINLGNTQVEKVLNDAGYETIEKEKQSILEQSLVKRLKLYESVIKGFDIREDSLNEVIEFIKKDEIGNINKYINNLTKKDILNFNANEELGITENGLNTFLEWKRFDSIDKGIYDLLNEGAINKEKLCLNKELNDIVINTEREFEFSRYDAFYIGSYFKKNGLAVDKEDKLKDLLVTDENIKNKIYSLHTDEKESEKNYKIFNSRLFKLLENGYVNFDENTKVYSLTDKFNEETKELMKKGIHPTSYDINFKNNILQGKYSVAEEELKDLLGKAYPNKQYVDEQYKYNIRRFNNLLRNGYIRKEDNTYHYTKKGIKALNELEYPNKDTIDNKLTYFSNLGLIENEGDGYKITPKFKFAIDNNRSYKSYKTVFELIDKYQGNINKDIIKESIKNEIIKMNNRLSKTEVDYKSLRNQIGVKCIKQQTIKNIGKVMMDARCNYEDIKETILKASNKFELSHNEKEIIIKELDRVYNKGFDNAQTYETKSAFSRRNWKDMFRTIGKEEPTYAYRPSYLKHKSLGNWGKGIESISKTLKSKMKKERMEDEHKKLKQSLKDKLKEQRKETQLNQARKQGKINKDTEYGLKNLGSVKAREESKEIER